MYVDQNIIDGLKERLEDHKDEANHNAHIAFNPDRFPSPSEVAKQYADDFEHEWQRIDEVKAIIAWLQSEQKKAADAGTSTTDK